MSKRLHQAGGLRRGLCFAALLAAGCGGESKPNVTGSLDFFDKPKVEVDDATTEPTGNNQEQPPGPQNEPQAPSAIKEFIPGEEHETFAREWTRVHNQNDTLGAYSLVDWTKVYERAFAGLTVGESQKEQFIQSIKGMLQGAKGVQRDIATIIANGGEFRLLGFRQKGDAPTAIFRVLFPNLQDVNYQEVELVKSADGRIRAAEMSSYRLDPPYSDELRAMFFDYLTIRGRQDVGTDKRSLIAYIQLRDFVRQNHPQDAIAFYMKLPDDIRKSRRCSIWFVEAARRTSPDNYVAALEEFRRLFPSDASLPLMQLEAAVVQRDPAAQLTAIDKVRSVIWDDPYLGALRTFSLLEQGNIEAALEEATTSLTREPTLRPAHWANAAVLAKQQRFDELVAALDDYAQRFSSRLDFTQWLALPAFESFLKSKEYEDWKGRVSSAGVKVP